MKRKDALRISADGMAFRYEQGCEVRTDREGCCMIKINGDWRVAVPDRCRHKVDWEPVNPGMCGEENRELLYEYARRKGIDPVLEGWV